MEHIRPVKIISLRLIIAFGLLFNMADQLVAQSACHIIGLSTTYVDGTGLYAPGDTLCLESGQRDYFLFKNINGTAEHPIVITNADGQVEIITPHFYGIKFDHCSHIKLSGAANPAIQYGIYISYVDQGTGVSIDNLSSQIEIEHLEIANIPIAGIYAKTEPYQGDCNNLITREKFTLFNLKIHDCYIHDIADEGMYIGSSKYLEQTVYECNNAIVLPHVIEGVSIYNNIVENTGWDGIQVSSAISGCLIYNNIIRNDSYRETNNQMSGILIGGGSNCDCYNNQIFDGKGDGIDILGFGNHKIFNNLIVRPGKTYMPNQPVTDYQKHGIWVGHLDTKANSELFIYNNTIVSPRTFGLKLTNLSISNYIIYNNLIVDPGAYPILNEDSFSNKVTGINFIQSNNLFKQAVTEIQFQNPANNNFDLQANSPAVNTGLNLTVYGLTFDILNRPRPFGSAFDIGAFETQESINGIVDQFINEQKSIAPRLMPNPLKNVSILKYALPKPMHVRLYLMDAMGKTVKILANENQLQNEHHFELNKDDFESGFYFVILECELGRFSEKIIII